MEQRSHSLDNTCETKKSQPLYDNLKLIRNVTCMPQNSTLHTQNASLENSDEDVHEYNNRNVIYFSNIPIKLINRQVKEPKCMLPSPPKLQNQIFSFRKRKTPQPSIIYHHDILEQNFALINKSNGDSIQPQFEDEVVPSKEQEKEEQMNQNLRDTNKNIPKTDTTLKSQTQSSSELSQRKNYYFQADKSESQESSNKQKNKSPHLRKKKLHKQKKQKILGKPYDVIFKWHQFFETLIPYFLFGFLIGPLTSFLLYFRTGSFHLAYNMGMYVKNTFSLITLYFCFLAITIIVFYKIDLTDRVLLYYSKYIFINFLMYLMLSIKYDQNTSLKIYLFSITLRNQKIEEFTQSLIKKIIFRIKGYMHSSKYIKYKTSYLKSSDLTEDYLRKQWKHQDPHITEKELHDSISRNEVEMSSFFIEFMCHPSADVMKKLGVQQYKKYKKLRIFNHERVQENMVECKNIINFYINHYNQNYRYKNISYRSAALVIIRFIFCLAIKIYPLIQNSDQDYYTYISYILMVIIESYCIFFFVEIAYILLNDLKRKEFMLIQLSYLISPKKIEAINESNRKKLLPTFTMGCPISIRSWGQMRSVVLDYGKVFEQRSNFFLSSYLLVIEAIAVFLLLNLVGIITINMNVNLIDILLTGFDFMLFFILTLKFFMTAAAINEQSDLHAGLIMNNKIIFTEISLNYKLYTNQLISLTSPVYSALIKSFSSIVRQIDNHLLDYQEYTWYIQELYQNLIQELKIFQDYKPMKVINIVVTKNLVIQILLSTFSAVFALLWHQALQPLLIKDF